MTIIKLENRFDSFMRDAKHYAKGFRAGAVTTIAVIGYLKARNVSKKIKEEINKMKEEEL